MRKKGKGAPAADGRPPIRLIRPGEDPEWGEAQDTASPGGKNKSKKPLSEFERYRRRLERSKRLRIVIGVTILTVAAAALVAVFGMFSDSRFGVDFRTRMARSSSYPVQLSGSAVRQIEGAGWNVALLDATGLTVYNSKGIESLNLSTGYAAPILKSEGERMLLYDQGGTRFCVLSPSRQLFEGEVASTSAIHAGDIAQNGTFAVAASTSKSASEITVRDAEGAEIFRYPSAGITASLALSPDGKLAAACLLGASDGHVVTTVVLLDLQNPKVLLKKDISEEFGYHISFKSSNICLITDRSVRAYDRNGKERGSYSFAGRQIMRFADGADDHLVIELGSRRYMRADVVVALDERCREQGTLTVESDIDSLRADNSGFYYLEGGVIYHYSFAGERLSRTQAPGTLDYLPLGQDLFTVSYEQLQKLTPR